ncbi:MAG: hypothetical protein JSW28_01105 [Thermoplasmata archaeon]|nr:MAG: hypothetical protein JSW28_01105 [Thermoplasmata archaeon]
MDTEFDLAGNITVDFTASTGIEHMFVKSSRTRSEKFHDIYAVLHELPDELHISVAPTVEYDMDGSLLQTLPTIDISSSGGTLDTFIFGDGEGIGQRGIFEVQVVDAPLSLTAEFKGDRYSVKSTGVDYLWVHVMELPVMEGYTTRSIELVGKDIKSFDIKVSTLFGNYPIITIENAKGGEAQMIIDHEMNDSDAGIALMDFRTKDGLPASPSILINGGSVDLEDGSTHILVPLPVLTFWLSVLG